MNASERAFVIYGIWSTVSFHDVIAWNASVSTYRRGSMKNNAA